ncbi:MAG: radical SAM protein [Anaerolineaceae bacterium]|jgi:radical SAM protein with 4Fe4S-binding SPASM domain
MECSVLEEVFIDDWNQGILEKLNGKRYPFGGLFELTDRCNLRCVHCYINQSAGCAQARESELNTDEVKAILDQLVNAGVLSITFTGGEVFLRQDFLEIYLYAKSIGLLVTIFTNGTLITPKIADVLAEYRPRLMEITLYGGTKETYEKVTGVPSSYDRCIKAIELILDRDILLYLKSIILKINASELSMMQHFAKERGLSFRYDGLIWPRLDKTEKSYAYRLNKEELVALDNGDSERMAEWKRIAGSFGGFRSRAEAVYNCGAGLRSFHIDSNGRLSACSMARKPNYELRTITFLDAWERIGEIRSLKRELNTVCRSCEMGGLCSQCPGWSQLVHGDDETPVEFVCELAHLRLKNLKKSII